VIPIKGIAVSDYFPLPPSHFSEHSDYTMVMQSTNIVYYIIDVETPPPLPPRRQKTPPPPTVAAEQAKPLVTGRQRYFNYDNCFSFRP